MEKKISTEVWFSKPFSYMAGLVQSALFGLTDNVTGTTKLYLNLIDIKKENLELKKSNNELSVLNAAMKDLQIENTRLSQLLGFKQKSKMNLIPAQVIARDLLPDHAAITINKGSNDGLKTGMAVLNTEGVVGHIFKPQLTSAHVLLITDRYSVVDTVAQRTRSRGLVEGKDRKTCILNYIDNYEDLKVGDLMVTSSLDRIFPKGFPVARIEAIKKESFAVSPHIELKPVVNADRVEEVFVILDTGDADYSHEFKGQEL